MSDDRVDGLCMIVKVTVYPVEDWRVYSGELRTDLSETFGVATRSVLEQAEICRKNQDRVKLDVRTSRAGHRYVTKITPLDQSRNPTPCVACGTYALLVVSTPEIPSHYQCKNCHLMMFQQPITRSYAAHDVSQTAPRD